ncbi:pentapeptide repeat-containing protein [Altericista sp. CCNU0014]|uniref:pentapeptide repeat-containing protein n=1 Tax=Altericista sp. CCNU0014 TaxID=3082949 RepID=UPI003850C615
MTKLILGLWSVVLIAMLWVPLPAYGASSAAIRAYDDVAIASKNFAGKNLQQAEFSDAQLSGADFSGADLRGVVFNGAVLTKANFQGVDMTDGLAYITDFSNADFTNAVLNGALLLKSTFRDATVTGADFSDAVLDKIQVVGLCQSASGVNPTTGVETRESLGCT